MLCGEYTGSITFFEEDGPQYIWYTVSITTNYPEAFQNVSLESEIRKKHVETLHIPYTLPKEGSYQAVINGLGLNGLSSVVMKPGADNVYQVEYLPLEVGEEKGSVCFINPEIGEILYEFTLRCHAKPPVIINNIKSPLGVSAFIQAELENPTNIKASIRVANTNPEQFALKSNAFKLLPFEKKVV